MWWRWLMHSPPVWQASLEGLKVTTIVPNPLGISPQMQVSCGWRRVHMHKQYNIDCLCDLCYLSSMCWKFLFVCLLFALNVFTFFFYQSLFVFVSKIQKHIKVENPKSLIDIIVYCHKHVLPCTFVLMALCIYEHSLFFMYSYHCGKNLDIYETIVNRSSNLSWMISQWFCWSWNLHRLVPIYLPTFLLLLLLFFFFCLKSSTNVNLKMKRDNELQKLSHILVFY